ncbi:hypothetical protein [Blastopirellula retiformator]|uniref:Uncharacterized protein n=1 Tax=Blastopirellula retiformator TaxID=2527970 RepID=A0A5C5V8Y6_9BACT|nr:hypothetical protein [Blastopirellula retiformator]TWT34317.1 hypothetical protein Enr8_17110 [Blastopirellula retiformator]
MIDQIFAITKKLDIPNPKVIERVESLFHADLPQLRQYWKRLGVGTLSVAMRVYSPERIEGELEEFRRRWKEYFLWGGVGSAVEPGFEADAIIIADSLDGDEVIQLPDGLYLLPRHRDVAVRIGDDLVDAIRYICSSGQIYTDIQFFWFESWVDRLSREFLADQLDFATARDFVNALPAAYYQEEPEDNYVSALLPDIEGSLTFIGAQAILHSDRYADVAEYVAALKELGCRPASS